MEGGSFGESKVDEAVKVGSYENRLGAAMKQRLA